jgi:hypothetical protein
VSPKQPVCLISILSPHTAALGKKVHQCRDMRTRLLESTHAASSTRHCPLWPSQRLCRANRIAPRIAQDQPRALPVDDLDLKQLLGQGYLRPDFEEYSDEHVRGVYGRHAVAAVAVAVAVAAHQHQPARQSWPGDSNHTCKSDNSSTRCDTIWVSGSGSFSTWLQQPSNTANCVVTRPVQACSQVAMLT